MSSSSASEQHQGSTGVKSSQDFASVTDFPELYSRVVRDMIEESYPPLKAKKTKIHEYGPWAPWYYYCSGYCVHSSGCYTIGLSRRLRKYDESTLRGVLAHELCHAEAIQKYMDEHKVDTFRKGLSMVLSSLKFLKPSLSKLLERQTDIDAVRKGYGKELLDRIKFRETEFPFEKKSAPKRGYLTSDEVLQFMREFNQTP